MVFILYIYLFRQLRYHTLSSSLWGINCFWRQIFTLRFTHLDEVMQTSLEESRIGQGGYESNIEKCLTPNECHKPTFEYIYIALCAR